MSSAILCISLARYGFSISLHPKILKNCSGSAKKPPNRVWVHHAVHSSVRVREREILRLFCCLTHVYYLSRRWRLKISLFLFCVCHRASECARMCVCVREREICYFCCLTHTKFPIMDTGIGRSNNHDRSNRSISPERDNGAKKWAWNI